MEKPITVTQTGKRPSNATKEEAEALMARGYSQAAIARLWHVSPGRVWQILHPKAPKP